MKHFGILILLLALSSCESINRKSSVPNVPVNYTVYIDREHPYFVVENTLATIIVTERKFQHQYIGYAGLLIWVGMDNAYHAADLCCPHCVLRNKPLQVDGLYAVCPICGEQYDISYGFCNPTKGITKESLKLYNISPKYNAIGRAEELYIAN